MNKIISYLKRNKLFIGIYILFFIICILTPISGDDYGNYMNGQKGLINILRVTKDYYFSWEGRVVSRLIILLFTSHKILWNIITPLAVVLIFKSLLKINTIKNKYSYILIIISCLLVNKYMFAQTYTWLAGSITYLYSTALVTYYFSFLYNNIDKRITTKQVILLSVISFIIPMFTENIGCAFVFGNILFIFYLYYLKKEVKINYLFLTISISGLILMLMSPGSYNRMNSAEAFYSLGLFDRIYINIENNLLKYTLTRNTIMILLMLICCNIFIIKKTNILRANKKILVFLFNMIPIYTILQNLNNIIFITKFLELFNINQLWYYPYWVIFGCVFLCSIITCYKSNKNMMLFYIILFLMALSSVLCMLLVWPWTDRISILFVVIVSFISINIIDENIKIGYRKELIIKMLLIFSVLWIVFSMFGIYKINNYRINYINEQKDSDKNEIEIIYNPFPYIWLSNIDEPYFVNTYKEYLNIDSNISLKLKKLSRKEYINIIISK